MRVGIDRLMQILAGPRRESHCRECGRPIEWAVLAGTPARYVALNPNPLVLAYPRNAGGVKLAEISVNNKHRLTCRRRQQSARRGRMFGGRARP